MARAIQAWRNGAHDQAASLCRSILAHRPGHQGAKHLLMTIEKGVGGVVFTAIMLHDPSLFDIGDFSYGVPSVIPHNQPDEPARLSIGRYCTIGHDVSVYLGSYHRQDTFTIYPFSAPHLGSCFPLTRGIKDYSCTRGGVDIGNDVWIGAHSVILSGVHIGDGAVIGAGSVVSRDVGAYEVWAGNPAEFRKRRFDEPTAERLLRLRWWDWPQEQIEACARDIMSHSEEALARLESIKFRFGQDKRLAGDGFLWVTGRSCSVRARRSLNWRADRPAWVVMHGSLGSIEAVAGIEPFLADTNLLFIDLPGSGKTAAPAEISVEGFAEELIPALRKLVPGDFRILGVSFGGTVALAVARRLEGCKGVVLLDSPFSAQKLWHNHLFLRGMIEREPDNSFIRNFALRIYGVTEHAAVERDYWYLLDALKIPVTVVTGDVAMMPVRPVPPVPCCLDGGDLERLQSLGAKVVRISGGHDLINDNTADVAQVVKAF